MVKDSYGCCRKETANLCVLKLVEEEKYCITTGIACVNNMTKNMATYHRYPGTVMLPLSSVTANILALSDGMGSGKSSNAKQGYNQLIEQFIESGIDRVPQLN